MEDKKNQEKLVNINNAIFIGISILVVISCSFIASLLISSGFTLQQKAINSEKWLVTTGTILSSEVEYRSPAEYEDNGYFPRIKYAYSVQGENYSGTRISFYLDIAGGFEEESKAVQYIQKYPSKANVSVYYNPSDYTESVLEPGTNDILNTHWRISSIIVFGVGVLFTFICRLSFHRRVSIVSIKLYGILALFLVALFGTIIYYIL